MPPKIFLAAILFSILVFEVQAQQPSASDPNLEWIPVPGKQDEFYMGQRGQRSLTLTANEVFFPKLGLTAVRDKARKVRHAELNQNKSFTQIRDWDVGDVAEWGLYFEKPGTISVMFNPVSLDSKQRFRMEFNGEKTGVKWRAFNDKNTPYEVYRFTLKKPGLKILRLVCTQSRGKGNRTMYGSIQVGGFEKGTAFVLRKRWRPKAAHARFSSSKKLEGVDTWIFEMDAAPGTLGFYSPMTTPFGYYGSSWLADGRVNKGINFSLWSFGRGKKEPPIEQLSHLLAIGNPDAKFGGFDHEGTGVKIRGWNPFELKPGQAQVFAARISRGEVYDTFYSYFFDSKELRWRLYGVGRKVKAKRPRPFFPGSFVEVPGRAEKQRTGAYVRRMRYRGWVLDGERRAHRIDQMSYADIDKDTGLTYTDRGLTKDGRFFLQTGGWSFRKVNKTNKDVVKLPASSFKSHPVCIIPVKLREILRTPSAIECTKLRREGQNVVVEFDVRNLSVMKDAVVYWGDQEALTFMSRWQNSRKISKIKEGANTVKISWSGSKKPLYVRLFLKNDEGQFWSTDTAILKP